jgi:beta-glucanase (GH16 family)
MRLKRKVASHRGSSQISCALESLESRLFLTAAPTGVSATNGATTTDIVVSWNAVSGANSYQVWRNTSASTTSATDINPDETGTSFDDVGVTVGTTYFYWVVTSDGSGNSAFSTLASATGGTLVFNDTFGATGISSAWGAENATDPNNHNVIYTNNSTGSTPTMQIVSDPESTNGQALALSLSPAPGKSGSYYSAEISTKNDPIGVGNSIEYGEIQARIKIPGGSNSNAIWPAFWMLGDDISSVGWPASGEIDIMENRGSEPNTIFSTIHGPTSNGTDYNGGEGVGSSDILGGSQDFYSSFHLFAVNWGPNSVTFSVDGAPFATLTPANLPSGASWVFNGHPFYMILDVCEGGNFAPGTITSKQTMEVDDVRAYSFPAPTSVAATIATSSTQAQVSWAAVTGATSYEVWRSNSSNVTTATELKSAVSGTTYVDGSASPGVAYYYWVVAANVAQTSGYSASALSVNKQTPTVTLPVPPSNIYYDGLTDVTNWITPTVTGIGGYPAPTGSTSLVYYNGTTPSGSALPSSPTGLGTYTVVANYSGDGNYLPAQSAPATFTIVNPAGLTTSVGAAYTISWAAGVPTLDVSAGAVTLGVDLSNTFSNYVLSIETGASVLLASSQNIAGLNLNGSGSLDVQMYAVIVHYGATDPIGSIVSWITSGYADKTWTGNGIFSSTAAQNPAQFGIGYADVADAGNPASLQSNTLKFQYALLGDANLDGSVNGTDFAILSANFGQSATRWDEGNFNYHSSINGEDFSALAGNFGQTFVAPSAVSKATVSSQVAAVTDAKSTSIAKTPASQLASAVDPTVGSSGKASVRRHRRR